MSLNLPRLDQAPYDDPAVFIATWAATMAAIEGASGSGGSDAAFAAWAVSGRLADIPETVGAPTLPPSPARAITIPQGARFILAGVLHTFAADTTVVNLQESFTGWLKLVASWYADAQAYSYSVTHHTTKPAPGTGILAKVTTSADATTAVDATDAEADVILTAPALIARLRSYGRRLDVVETGSGEGGGGTGEVTLAMYNALAARVCALTQQLEDLQAREAPVEVQVASPVERVWDHLGRVETELVRINAYFAARSEAAIVVPGKAGNGETLSGGTVLPDHVIGGNMIYSPTERALI